MGYYSKVSVLCGKNVANRLIDLPSLYMGRVKMRKDGLFRFYWDSVRWPAKGFSDANETDAIMEVVNASISKPIGDDGIDDFCSFIRIGDDVGDDEHYNNSAKFEKQFLKTELDLVDDEPWEKEGRAVMVDCGQSGALRLRRCGVWPV